MAHVFEVNADHPAYGRVANGWYYQIDLAEPVGPFPNAVDAGKAARATIIETVGNTTWPPPGAS